MLCNILMLLLCIPSIKYLSSVPTNRRNVESKTTFRALFRKRYNAADMALLKSKSKNKLESIYEPYWANGDWVYYRGDSTRKPEPFYLNDGNATQHDECNQICPQFMQDYGFVCAARYNVTTTKYEHYTFEDYCYLEYENCYMVSKIWFPVKKGNCTEMMTTQQYTNSVYITQAYKYEASLIKEESQL